MPQLRNFTEVQDKLERIRTRIASQEAVRLDARLSHVIIDALRLGTAPIRGAVLLAVGRETVLEGVRRELEHVSAGNSVLRVLNGEYGMGKTLTLRVLQDYAFQRGFATSFVTLTPRECPLYDLRAVYEHIVKSVRVEECRDRPALELILENWAEKVKSDVRDRGRAPWSFWKLSLPFKEALTVYFDATSRNNFVLAEKALSWIHGDVKTLRDARQLGVSGAITSSNALEILGDLTRMIRELGLCGLVILLDEAETIPSICGMARRMEAYQNLNKLANGAGSTPYSYFVYATTPPFFDFLADCGLGKTVIARQRITTLENLSRAEFVDLALVIRDLYLQAYGWKGDERTRDARMRALVFTCLDRLKDRVTPRLIVRILVKSLDLCHENRGLSFGEIMTALAENVS